VTGAKVVVSVSDTVDHSELEHDVGNSNNSGTSGRSIYAGSCMPCKIII